MCIPTLERFGAGPNYVCRSKKVGFPNLQMNDLLPGCLQSLCLDEHIEGRFCSESCQSLRKFQGDSPKFKTSPLRREGHREKFVGWVHRVSNVSNSLRIIGDGVPSRRAFQPPSFGEGKHIILNRRVGAVDTEFPTGL